MVSGHFIASMSFIDKRVDERWPWARLERLSTGSWMTVCLGPFPAKDLWINRFISEQWPEWELVHWSIGCPDDDPPELCPDWPQQDEEMP
jgi:hypothetical protein